MAKKTASQVKQAEIAKKSAKAFVKHLRISPRKARLVVDAIRWKPVYEAARILATLNKKAASMAAKLLKSAVANAKVLGLDESRLYVSDVRADGGPVFKRFMSRSMGRADRLLKRTTHLSMIVTESDRKLGGVPAPQEADIEKEGTAKGKAPKKKKVAKAAKSSKKASAAK